MDAIGVIIIFIIGLLGTASFVGVAVLALAAAATGAPFVAIICTASAVSIAATTVHIVVDAAERG